MRSLQPKQDFLGFSAIASFTSGKTRYSSRILTENKMLYFPVTHYGRDKIVNILLFLSKTPWALLWKVQRGKKK